VQRRLGYIEYASTTGDIRLGDKLAQSVARLTVLLSCKAARKVRQAARGEGHWRPAQLRPLEPLLRSNGHAQLADGVAAVAALLESWVARDEKGAAAAAAQAAACLGVVRVPELHAALPSRAELRALLRSCDHPGCANLAGDSEGGLPLKACARCGAASYCSRECQVRADQPRRPWLLGWLGSCLGVLMY
jgi:hypothetical protein